MTWLSIVLFIIVHIPDFISAIEAIIRALHGHGIAEVTAARERISAAIESGDLGQVRKVVRSQGECLGVACPSDLKGSA